MSESRDDIDYTDRYRALGVPYPDPATVCRGPCEGLGVYPERRACCNTTEFVPCPRCSGTGKEPRA